jgi:hypothetical protein
MAVDATDQNESGRAPEAFGQLGVRQFLVPALSLVMLFLAGLSAVMWYRSFDTTDMFNRRIGTSTWAVYSIYGRIVVTRQDLAPSAGRTSDTGWQYGAQPAPYVVDDLWIPSWRKTIGIEWRGQPIGNNPIIVDGWWVRIRWRTVLVLSAIVPVARGMREWRRSRARLAPAFEVVTAQANDQ